MQTNRKDRMAIVLMLLALIAALGAGSAHGATGRPHPAIIVEAGSRGALVARAREDGQWISVGEQAPFDHELWLRTVDQAAALSLRTTDGPLGRVWLRDATTLQLVRDDAGRLLVMLKEGQVRLSLFDADPETLVATGRGTRDVTASDVLLRRVTTSELVSIAPTWRFQQAAAWTVELDAGAEAAAGLGTLVARNADGDPGEVTLRALHVDATLTGDLVETRVEHVFSNPTDQVLEGTFRFPLPEDASVIGLAMEIDGRLMEGAFVERDKARRIYREIVDSMRDPAILEWEDGQTFKLRVFPIEAHADKRIVITYVTPLVRGPEGWEMVYETAAPGMQVRIPDFRMTFDGCVVAEAADFRPGRDFVVHVPDDNAPAPVLREDVDGSAYLAASLEPDWSLLGPTSTERAPARRLVVIVDTSRSALETRELALETLQVILGDLRRQDRFVVMASDVEALPHAARFVAPTRGAVEAALEFIEGIEADGATDLGAAIERAGALIRGVGTGSGRVQVVYLGDGTPTWGQTDPAALAALADERLGDASFFAVSLGRSATTELLRDIAGAHGGRVARPRTVAQAHRFALFLQQAPRMQRITGLRVLSDDGSSLYPRRPTTLFRGDSLKVVLRPPEGREPPPVVRLVGRIDGAELSQELSIEGAAPARHVARRWAAGRIAELQRAGGGEEAEEAIVALSTRYHILTKHTALLVLESEEAYERYRIEREARRQREAAERGDPTVSGADLQSVNPAASTISASHIQPGDPEIRIPAPADARSVVVVLPFGETKLARWEPELGLWTVRFLIDDETPDGTYEILIRITLADGSVRIDTVAYVVDTLAPTVAVTLRPKTWPRGTFVIRAEQVLTEAELRRVASDEELAGDREELERRVAHILTDVRRVDVALPDGTVLPLTAIRTGVFRGFWKPESPLAAGQPVTLRVVTVDRALNVREQTVSIDPEGLR